MNYNEFLETKTKRHIHSGFDIPLPLLNPLLFDWQKHAVKTALSKGRFALFMDCGLGKTFMQLEWANQVAKHTKGRVLILAPLAVTEQTIIEACKFNIDISNVDITNYEQLHNIDVSIYSGVVLDESSILKNFTGKYKRLIIELFADTEYKLACTATPSPNDLNEIGNHSEFLGVLDAQDMRAKWFVRDEGMNNYRLKGHAKRDFYGWISSWAMMVSNPSDIGYCGDAYVLPQLIYHEHQVITKRRDNGLLFNEGNVNATSFNRELKRTLVDRCQLAADIANSDDKQYIVWVNQNAEEKLLLKLIPDAKVVTGSEKADVKKAKLLGFAKNEFRVLITKKKIAQFGLNYQNCYNQIFCALDFSFEGLYQAIRRSYRFGQINDVNIHIITTDTMENVVRSIERKQAQFNEMQSEMNKFINGDKFGLLDSYDFAEFKTKDFHLMKGDSTIEIKRVPDNSVDLIIYSPPFSSLFTYSNYIHDMGNNDSHEEFFVQYGFLLKELYRILRPGRLMVCHTKDLAVYKNSSGYSGLYDFTADHSRSVQEAGFKYHSKINIWTDPILEMQRTKTQRLLYKQLRKDSTYTGVGLPEYCTVFRKWEGDEKSWTPVNNKNTDNFPLETWQRWASPVWNVEPKDVEHYNNILKGFKQQTWMDIKRTDVLNNREGTALGDEKHIAPLQLSVIRKCVQMWSNVGETVFTPFLGIGSEVYESVKLGRKGIGIELKDKYYETAIKNCNNAVAMQAQAALF